ncbi:hypothetical protein PMAYCL1PPCAC_31368, partial [Pristionchus mayeri]
VLLLIAHSSCAIVGDITNKSSEAVRAKDDSSKNFEDFPGSPPLITASQTILLGVSTARITDDDEVLEERFGRIVEEAAAISRSIKYGLEREEGASPTPSSPSSSSLPLVGKLIKREST